MIPVYLDPRAARILLIGRGPLFARRLAWLRDLGAAPEVVDLREGASPPISGGAPPRQPGGGEGRFSLYDVDQPTDCPPDPGDFRPGQLVWIAGLDDAESESLAGAARRAGALVNVEDRPALCDFHTPAILRRGRLTLAAGTGGASPAAARFVREKLEAHFPPEWEDALEEVSEARAALRAGAASFETLSADARARLARRGLI